MPTREQLEQKLAKREADHARIRKQIEDAMVVAREYGKYADPVWFHRARRAKCGIGRDINRLRQQLADLRRTEQRSLAERFLVVCRNELDESDFQYLMERAEALA